MLLDKTILIHAPATRVFEWLDPSRMPLWDRSLVRAAPRDASPLHAGSVIDLVSRALGLRFESATEATRVEDGRVYAWRQVDGDFEAHQGAYVLEPDGDGTRLRLLADVELPFVLPRLATEAEVQRALSRDADEALFRLKDLVEAQGGGRPTGAS